MAVVGVIAPAAKRVKEFVFIKLPKKGAMIKKGETYVSLEAVEWRRRYACNSGISTGIHAAGAGPPARTWKRPSRICGKRLRKAGSASS